MVYDVDVHLFAVCNSRLIGGGRLIAPEAVIDDGWLDVCVVEAMPTLEFVGLLREVARGEHLGDPRVTYFRARSAPRVRPRDQGEHRRAGARGATCRYTVLPRAARFLTPRR